MDPSMIVAGTAVPAPLAALVAAPARLRLSNLRDRRFAVHMRCEAACFVSARLALDARSSHRTGLTRRSGVAASIGRARAVRTTATSFALTIEVTPRALRALKRLRRARLRLRVSATGATRSASLERSISYLR